MDTKTAIAELRKLGYSQAAIASACNVTQGAISHIETGRRKDVRASTYSALIELLDAAQSKAEIGDRASSANAAIATA